VKKGDFVLTDCNVTGTDIGTPDKPKFSLRLLWEYCLLPSLDALVAIGGQCEGATVVHQEDNAGIMMNLTLTPYPNAIPILYYNPYPFFCNFIVGPHKKGGFHQWLTSEFVTRGWKLELQAPQGPYRTSWTFRYSPP
jgi:hypothetical protein